MSDLVGNLEGRFSRDAAYLEGGVQRYGVDGFVFPFVRLFIPNLN